MEPDYSRRALMEFFGYMAAKGLGNSNTIAARKAAANKMLSILDASESLDLRNVDLDQVATRFFNLHAKEFTPESMVTYKSRLKSGIEDFISYTTNPSSFKPDAPRQRTSPKGDTVSPNGTSGRNAMEHERQAHGNHAFPIPIRSDVTVKLIGIPSDLTAREAQKIANVIMALSTPE
jgi:site-specific recombinase XerD